MADGSNRGSFVWYELKTPDASASHRFYARAVGWKTEPFAADPSYLMFAASSGPVGGTEVTDTEPPRWLPYIGADDLDGTLAKAIELGAQVVAGPGEGGGGQYAILKDPQGVEFGVYASPMPPRAQSKPKRGEYAWHELLTRDAPAALEFYAALFGWEKIREHELAGEGNYLIFGREGQELGGMFNKPSGGSEGQYWLGYVRVKNIHQSIAKIEQAGGTVVVPAMEVPSGDWVAQAIDPQGALLAIYTPKGDMPAPARLPAAAEEEADSHAETTVLAEAAERSPAQRAARKPARPAKKKAAKKTVAAAKQSTQPTAQKASKKASKKAAKKAAKKKVGNQAAKKTAKKAAKKAAKNVGRAAAKSTRSSRVKTGRAAPKKKAKQKAGAKRAGKKQASAARAKQGQKSLATKRGGVQTKAKSRGVRGKNGARRTAKAARQAK